MYFLLEAPDLLPYATNLPSQELDHCPVHSRHPACARDETTIQFISAPFTAPATAVAAAATLAADRPVPSLARVAFDTPRTQPVCALALSPAAANGLEALTAARFLVPAQTITKNLCEEREAAAYILPPSAPSALSRGFFESSAKKAMSACG
jgi:hypothetical protein